MSKYTIKLKLQGLELEVEGTTADAPKIAAKIGEQFGEFFKPAALLETSNGHHTTLEGDVDGNGAGKENRKNKRAARKPDGSKTAVEELNFVHDSTKYGTPSQEWTGAQKAIWFLWVTGEQTNVKLQTTYSIMKSFNSMFRAAGMINNGNIMKAFEKEKLKGANAPVGSDMTGGTAKYFLTDAGIALAQRLAKGEAVPAE
jgi:hypothetical protein